ncbi:MAG: SGNH hydrolase domain-containing protein [Acidimicrobiales bacterium]
MAARHPRRDLHPSGVAGRRGTAGLVTAGLVTVGLLVGACGAPQADDGASGTGTSAATAMETSAPPAGTTGTTVPATTTTAAPPPRVALFGDSTALMSAFGLAGWLLDTGRGVPVDGRVDLGCSILRGGLRRDHIGIGPNNPVCDDWPTSWGEMLRAHRPDLAVVQTGPWDILDHQFAGESVWRAPGDPTFDAALAAEMDAVLDLLSGEGAHVVWLTLPPQRTGVGAGPGGDTAPATDPARADRYNAVLRQVAAARPDDVTVLPYAEWLVDSGLDETLRPDGIHVAFDTSRTAADLWLGDQIVSAAP